ncbi:DUF362 domain-containing protein [Metallumcola ferriviriculae]|uniref:DUF362 domain-containing protein n=1 Tax=Metallumcola ferriviriculae TaxID=3039180 RepID=A0AAU0UKL5_9FIRM|nr:DUF362 domain-containing protein [Desulfitibacteraceae bacterium MK1]
MSKVIIKECKSYVVSDVIEKINDGIKEIGGWNKFVKAGDKVLLKVNLIGPKTSETAAVTHSEFVRAMTRILKQEGCTVWIGDSSGGAIAGMAPTARSFRVAGYESVAQEEGAVIKNFDREGVVGVRPESNNEEQMYLAKPLFDADVVINLPKLKTHTAGIFTGAVKNVFGCIPGLKKANYHKMSPDPEDFGETIADIHQGARFHLHIMDGITAMQGEGPTAGEVYRANKILISEDPLALDTVAAKMLAMEIDDIPILIAAKKRGLGESKIEDITLNGDYQSVPNLPDFQLPKRFRSTKKRNHKALVKVIDFFKTRPEINLKKCQNCNVCVESCPMEAIDQETKKIAYNICIECMCCHELCMHKAVDLKKEKLLAQIATKLYRGKYR